MREKEKQIFNTLDEAMPEEIFFLPCIDSLSFLITVILSQSNTDRQAEESAHLLFERFPDAESIASADTESIEKLIHSSGLSASKSNQRCGALLPSSRRAEDERGASVNQGNR